MFKSPLTPEQWAQARRLRAEGATFAVIGRQFAITANSVAKRAQREGWPSPPGSAVRSAHSSSGLPPGDSADVRRRLQRRLFTVMDLSLELMEIRMHKQLKQA